MISGKLVEADSCCRELEEFTRDDNRVTLMEEKSTLGFIESEIAIFKSGLAFSLGKSNAIEDYIRAMQNVHKESLPLAVSRRLE